MHPAAHPDTVGSELPHSDMATGGAMSGSPQKQLHRMKVWHVESDLEGMAKQP